jgi:hypothetical protein
MPSASPPPPLRGEVIFLRAEPSGEGKENLKEAGGQRPPAYLKTSPLSRVATFAWTVRVAGGGPPLCYGLLREGRGWGRRATVPFSAIC